MADKVFVDIGTPQVLNRVGADGVTKAESIPFWGDAPEAWETAYLNGNPLPGLAAVTGDWGQKLDERSAPGENGVKFTHLGYEPTAFTITIRVWTKEQLDALVKLVPILKPRANLRVDATSGTGNANTRPEPQDAKYVSHPTLAMWGISKCIIRKMGLMEPVSGFVDVYQFRIQCSEFVRTKSKVATTAKAPQQSITSLGPGAFGATKKRPSETNAGP